MNKTLFSADPDIDYVFHIDGNARTFQSCQEQAEIYRQLESVCGTDAVALYRAASKLRKG